MESQIRTISEGNSAVSISSVGVYSFEISTPEHGYHGKLFLPALQAYQQPLRVQGYQIIPYGGDNRYPEMIQEILDNNHLARRVIETHVGLLWGSGPMLYRISFSKGRRKKTWSEDQDIQKWLNTWDYKQYLQRAALEFHTYRGHFTKFHCHLSHDSRKGSIHPYPVIKLENIPNNMARLEWPDEDGNIQNVIISDSWESISRPLKRYPLLEQSKEGLVSESVAYSKQDTFALETEYPRSSIHGSINWIRISSMVPKILANLNMNAAAIKYHMKSPAVYWEKHKERLEKECAEKGIEYSDKVLEDFKTETFSKVTATMAGIENAGKMLTTEEFYDATAGKYTGWVIEVLDQNVKNFIDAQINIAKAADFEVTAGLGMYPALSNVPREIGLSKGSELIYSYKLYQFTGIDIPESIVMCDINRAIRMNFPTTDLRLGFVHY